MLMHSKMIYKLHFKRIIRSLQIKFNRKSMKIRRKLHIILMNKINSNKCKKSKFTVSYDMGCPRRATGNLYNPIYCRAFMIVFFAGKYLSGILVANKCAWFDISA